VATLVLALSVGVAHAVFGSLTFIEQEKDGVGGVDGLQAAEGLAVSPDGANVYVVGQNEDTVAAFSRDPGTGALSFVEFEKEGVDNVDGIAIPVGVAVSPDGLSVYVTGGGAQDNAVATFSRVAPTGELDWVGVIKDGDPGVDGLASPQEVVVSPDGDHVYVASLSDDGVSAFARDPGNGTLTFIDVYKDGVDAEGTDGAVGLAISPDGDHVYVTGTNENAVATFSRDESTGELTFVEFDQDGVGGVDGLAGATDVAISPNGANVYVASAGDSAVATFSRDMTTGALTFLEQERDGVDGVDGLFNSYHVAVSPDGAHVYASGYNDDAVVTFARDAATGALAFVEQDVNGVAGVAGLDGPKSVAVSGDGAHVYVSGRNANAVVAFAREPFVAPPPIAGDTDPPETTITKGPKKKSKKKKAKFEFASDEPGSTFQCKLDKGGFEPCDPAETFKVKRKKHQLQVRAVDPAGNVDPTPAERSWKVKKKRKKK